MTKFDDIPQDVWDAAEAAVERYGHLYGGIEIMARAILAERERCYAVATEYAKQFPEYPEFDEAHNHGMSIAAAIRTPSP